MPPGRPAPSARSGRSPGPVQSGSPARRRPEPTAAERGTRRQRAGSAAHRRRSLPAGDGRPDSRVKATARPAEAARAWTSRGGGPACGHVTRPGVSGSSLRRSPAAAAAAAEPCEGHGPAPPCPAPPRPGRAADISGRRPGSQPTTVGPAMDGGSDQRWIQGWQSTC